GADDGGQERVKESLGHEALDQVLSPHPQGTGHPHLSLPLLREHDEDVHDQQDARDDREETEEDEHLAEPIHALRRTLDGVCLRLRNREGGTRREVRTDLSDGRIGPKVPNLLPAGVRNEDRVDLTRHPEVRLEGIEAEEEVVPIVPSASPFVSDDLEHRDGNRDEPSRPTEVQGEFIARLRLDGLGELRIDDRLRRAEAGPRPRGPVRPDEGTEVPSLIEADQGHRWIEEPGRSVYHGPVQLNPRCERRDVGHRPEVCRQGIVDAHVEGQPASLRGGDEDRLVDEVEGTKHGAPDRGIEGGLDDERRGDDRGPDQEARDDDRDLGLAAEECAHADRRREPRSSANTMSGSFTRARAIATLCCCPPLSSAGFFIGTSLRPTATSAATAFCRAGFGSTPRTSSGSSTFSTVRRTGNRL